MGLFGVRVGLGADGKNQIENKMPFVAVAIVSNGNGRIIPENRDAIRKGVPIDIDVSGADERNGGFDGVGWDGDGNGSGHGD